MCRHKITEKFSHMPIQNMKEIFVYVNRFQSTDSILDSNRTHRKHVLTEENMDEVGARLKTCSRKSLSQIAEQTDISAPSAPSATKLLRLHQYKTTVVHKLCNTRL
jgi:hypothetical protein